MKAIATTALILALGATPAIAEQGAAPEQTGQQSRQQGQQQEALSRQAVMGSEVFSADGQSIGQVVDALETPDGDLVAIAVVDPDDPEIGLALPAEMLSQKEGRLTAAITTDEIAALPDPEMPGDEPDQPPQTMQ